MRRITLILSAILLAGCVTASGRVGARVLSKHLNNTATTNPTPDNTAAARLSEGLSRQVGAPAEAPEPTAENMNLLSDQMKVEEKTWEDIKGFFSNLLGKLPSGVGEGILGGLAIISSIVAFLKNKRAAQLGTALVKTVATANTAKHAMEDVISGKETKVSLETAVTSIRSMGQEVSTIGKIIQAVYLSIKK